MAGWDGGFTLGSVPAGSNCCNSHWDIFFPAHPCCSKTAPELLRVLPAVSPGARYFQASGLLLGQPWGYRAIPVASLGFDAQPGQGHIDWSGLSPVVLQSLGRVAILEHGPGAGGGSWGDQWDGWRGGGWVLAVLLSDGTFPVCPSAQAAVP